MAESVCVYVYVCMFRVCVWGWRGAGVLCVWVGWYGKGGWFLSCGVVRLVGGWVGGWVGVLFEFIISFLSSFVST